MLEGMSDAIPERNLTVVGFVGETFHRKDTCHLTCIHILGRDLINVKNVGNPSHREVV